MMAEQDFCADGYLLLVSELLARDYEPVFFEDVQARRKDLLLRHDIDMSIEAALKIASIEAELGVKSTFFVLVRSEIYNPWSAEGKSALDEIVSLGHQIGLHFDTSLYSEVELDAACQIECNVLEQLISRPINIVSFHRPAQHLLGSDRKIGGYDHVYQPKYFEAIGYCADSQGRWRFGHPLEHDALKHGVALQLLTHPIWWHESKSQPPVERLNAFATSKATRLRDALAANCKPYAEVLASESAQS